MGTKLQSYKTKHFSRSAVHQCAYSKQYHTVYLKVSKEDRFHVISFYHKKSPIRAYQSLKETNKEEKKMLGVFLKEKVGNREHYCQDLRYRLMSRSVSMGPSA